MANNNLALLSQLHFSATLTLLSDLHIGNGETEKLSRLRPNSEAKSVLPNDADPLVKLIVRGYANDPETPEMVAGNTSGHGKQKYQGPNYPVIPATSLKGALRSSLRNCISPQAIEHLFGNAKNTIESRQNGEDAKIDTGKIGTVWLRAAKLICREPQTDNELPYWCAKKWTYISTHVKLDPQYGTSEDQHLFTLERVPTGCQFELRGIVFGDKKKAEDDLKSALAPLKRELGLSIGAGERFGSGRLQIVGGIEYSFLQFLDGSFKKTKEPYLPILRPKKKKRKTEKSTLQLVCQGPYLSVDRSKINKSSNSNTRHAARRSRHQPHLAPESLMGALRTRARWLATMHDIQNKTVALYASTDVDRPQLKETGWLDKFGRADESLLQPMELMFGVAGWKGRLKILSIQCEGGKLYDDANSYTGTSICRFSQATLDGALFSTEYFIGSSFNVHLALNLDDLEDISETQKCALKQLWKILLEDVNANGLMLGHATNSGFGWFNCKRQYRGESTKQKDTVERQQANQGSGRRKKKRKRRRK